MVRSAEGDQNQENDSQHSEEESSNTMPGGWYHDHADDEDDYDEHDLLGWCTSC